MSTWNRLVCVKVEYTGMTLTTPDGHVQLDQMGMSNWIRWAWLEMEQIGVSKWNR